MTSPMLILFPFLALLAGILAQFIAARFLSARAKGWLAFISAIAALGGVLILYPAVWGGQALEFRLAGWDGPFALAYHVDGLSLLFALMATGIGAAVLLYSISYMADYSGATRFYILMLVFIAGLVHLVASADLLAMYLSWEVIGLCSFLLVGFWYREQESAAGARKVLVMTHIAGYGLLAAIIIIFTRTGSTLWTDPLVAQSFNSGLFLLVLTAAVAKSVQFPLHTWIPDAMAAPTPVSALLHAACYVKAGVYMVARLHSLGPWPPSWGLIVLWIGVITMAVGVLYALIQTDLKRMLAFHTVSQIGYMMTGLGLGTPLGVAAGLLHCLNHGFFKGGLFLGAGAVQHATGTRNMDELGGLSQRMPRTTLYWLISAGSIAGVPLLSGFVSKWLLYNAALEAGQLAAAVVAWVVSILTVFSFLKATSAVFLGQETKRTAKAEEAPPSMRWGMGILAAGSLILGIAPQIAIVYLINPLLPAVGLSPAIDVTWFGLSVASGAWASSAGLILAIIATAAGGIIYFISLPARQMIPAGSGAAGGVFTGGEPLGVDGRLPAADFSAILKASWAPFYHWIDPDRYYLVIWRSLLGFCRWIAHLLAPLEKYAIVSMAVLAALLLVLLLMITSSTGALPIQAFSLPIGTLIAGAGLAWLALLITAASQEHLRRLWPLMLFSGGAALASFAMPASLPRLAMLEGASLLAMLLVWWSARDKAAAWAYLAAIIISAAAVVAGEFLGSSGQSSLALALILTGFALKLAVIPLYLWLPKVAEAVPAIVIGLIIAVVDICAFGELALFRQEHAALFVSAVPWLALALLSSLLGAVLMLAQHDLKRMLAFSSIEDFGYLLLGVGLAGEWGLSGALLGAAGHAMAKALLFICLATPEEEEPVTLASSGLADRYPFSGAGFLVGTLGILGIPPAFGFIGRWRLYAVAAQVNPLLLVLFLLATALAVLAYARALCCCWWGTDVKRGRRETFGVSLVVVLLIVCILAFGFFPAQWPAISALLGG